MTINNRGNSAWKVIIIVVILLFVVMYFVGSIAENSGTQEEQDASNEEDQGLVEDKQEPLRRDPNVSLEGIPENTPDVLKEFYILNSLNFELPTVAQIEWVSDEGDSQTYNGFSTVARNLDTSITNLTGEFISFATENGFTPNKRNSSSDLNSGIDILGISNKKDVCLLETVTDLSSDFATQTFSCASL